MEIKIDKLDNIRAAAQEFIKNMGEARVFAFYGKMGAGKTTFVLVDDGEGGLVMTSATPSSSQMALTKVVLPAPILP